MSDGVFWPEFEQWLREHGIEPGDCYRVEVAWTPKTIHGGQEWRGPVGMEASLWLRRDGFRYRDPETGDVASVTRTIPMRHLPAVDVVRYRSTA
jgi:hypothetical protein